MLLRAFCKRSVMQPSNLSIEFILTPCLMNLSVISIKINQTSTSTATGKDATLMDRISFIYWLSGCLQLISPCRTKKTIKKVESSYKPTIWWCWSYALWAKREHVTRLDWPCLWFESILISTMKRVVYANVVIKLLTNLKFWLLWVIPRNHTNLITIQAMKTEVGQGWGDAGPSQGFVLHIRFVCRLFTSTISLDFRHLSILISLAPDRFVTAKPLVPLKYQKNPYWSHSFWVGDKVVVKRQRKC